MSARKEVDDLLRRVSALPGWRVERTSMGFAIFPPDKAHQRITLHTTPSDHRWKANATAALRRAGASL